MKGKKWLMPAIGGLTTLAIVATAALVPVVLLQAGDNTLLNTPVAYSGNVGSLPFLFAETPVIQALYSLEGAHQTGDYAMDQLAIQSHEPGVVEELFPRVHNALTILLEHGVLPMELMDYLETEIYPRPQLNFSHMMDNMGFETINMNFGMGTQPPCYVSLTFEMSSGLVTFGSLELPADAPYLVADDIPPRLAGYLRYLGLDMAGDWREYAGSYEMASQPDEYGDIFNLYSLASESLLATAHCGWSHYTTSASFSFGLNTFITYEESFLQEIFVTGPSSA